MIEITNPPNEVGNVFVNFLELIKVYTGKEQSNFNLNKFII
jgi:hypothetical protein